MITDVTTVTTDAKGEITGYSSFNSTTTSTSTNVENKRGEMTFGKVTTSSTETYKSSNTTSEAQQKFNSSASALLKMNVNFNNQYIHDPKAQYKTPVRAARENDKSQLLMAWDVFSLAAGFVTKPLTGVGIWAVGKVLGSGDVSNTGSALFYRREGSLFGEGNIGSETPKDVNEWINSGRGIDISIPGPKK